MTAVSTPEMTVRGIAGFIEHQARRSHVVRTQITVGVIEPIFFLLVMGFGVGSFVDRNGSNALDGLDYLSFIGPGLLATTAVQVAAMVGLWPTSSEILWDGGYRSALTTPLSIDELVTGHILWIGLRLFGASLLFTLVLTAFGITASWWAVLAPLVAGLVATACGGLASAFAASQKQDHLFPLVLRLGVMPMFLFSGAFFPIETLPTGVAWAARLTPAWHGVELCRALILGTIEPADIGHVLYLAVLALVGWQWARRTFRRALAL